jgi:hypothetical protein
VLTEIRSGYRREPEPGPGDGDPSRRMTLAAIVVIAVLLAIGVFLTHVLRSSSALEDCLMQGRTNCAPIAAKSQ